MTRAQKYALSTSHGLPAAMPALASSSAPAPAAAAARRRAVTHDAGQHERASDAQDDRRVGQRGDEHEAGAERPAQRAERREGRQPPDDGARLLQVAELQLHDRRDDRAEHGSGREEPQEAEQGELRRPAVLAGLAQEPHDRQRRHRQQAAGDELGAEQATRRRAVGQAPARPRPEGDAGQDDADDGRVGLERDADVGGQQPGGEDLQDEHRR